MAWSDLPPRRYRVYIKAPEAGGFFERITADSDFAERWVERNQNRNRSDGHGLWAVETRDGGELAGDCGLTYQELGDRRLLEVGYHMTAAVRGRGYATEAARGCLRYAFEELGGEIVYSMVDLVISRIVSVLFQVAMRDIPSNGWT